MPKKRIYAQLKPEQWNAYAVNSSSSSSSCSHERMLIGLDCSYCPDCKREFLPHTKEYKLLVVAPDTRTAVSGADSNEVAPDTVSKTSNHWVEAYAPAKREQKYYRYVWMEGRKLRHMHIPGGNAKSLEAQALKEIVENAIARGESPAMIEQLIKSRGNHEATNTR